jgi:hypothetical protein
VIVRRNVWDEVKVGELDDVMLNARIPCFLAAPENHKPIPEEMEVPALVCQCCKFLASSFVHAASFVIQTERSKANRGTNLQIEK